MKTCSAKFQLQNLLNTSNSFLCYILVLWMHQPALLYVLSSSFCSYPQEFQDKGKSRAFLFYFILFPPPRSSHCVVFLPSDRLWVEPAEDAVAGRPPRPRGLAPPAEDRGEKLPTGRVLANPPLTARSLFHH